MSEGGFGIIDTLDENGGTIRNIVGIDFSQDTVTPKTLANGMTAHNAQGEAIVGEGDISNTYMEPIELEVDMEDMDFDLEMDTAIEHITIEGHGLPPGGEVGDIVIKRSVEDYDVAWVAPASSVEKDNTRPITSAAVYTEIGNINALLATI